MGISARLTSLKLLGTPIEGVEPAEDVPPTAVLIVDCIPVLKATKEIPATFEELATSVFHSVVPQTTLARRIDFVTDTYPGPGCSKAD